MESFLLLYSNDYLILKAFEESKEELLHTRENGKKNSGILLNLVVHVSQLTVKYKATTAVPSFPGEAEQEVDTSDLMYVLKENVRYYYDSNKELRFVVSLSSMGEELVAKITGSLKDNTLVVEDANYKYTFMCKGKNLTQVRKIAKNDNIQSTKIDYKVIEEPSNVDTRYSIIKRSITNKHLVGTYARVTKYRTGEAFIYLVSVGENRFVSDCLYAIEGKEYDEL